MKIFVKDTMAMCGGGGGIICLEVELGDTIGVVKRKLQDGHGGIPMEYQELIGLGWKVLQDKNTLEDYNISQFSTIDLRYKYSLTTKTEPAKQGMKRAGVIGCSDREGSSGGKNSSQETGEKRARWKEINMGETYKDINQNDEQKEVMEDRRDERYEMGRNYGGNGGREILAGEVNKTVAQAIPLIDMGGRSELSREMFPCEDVFSHPSDKYRAKLCPNPDDFHKVVDTLSCKEDMQMAIAVAGKWSSLTREMASCFNNMQQEKVAMNQKILIWKEIYRVVRMEIDCSIFVFGSTFNGFGASGCDIDMCVFPKGYSMGDKQWLTMVRSLLEKHCGHFIPDEIELVSAKVPVLKFKYSVEGSSFDVDLSVNNSTCVRNSHLLYCYSQSDYRVRPLVLAIKLWAKDHKINDAKLNTLSSYTLTLMVLHYLQCGVSPPVVPCLHRTHQQMFNTYSDIFSLLYTAPRFSSLNSMSLGELLVGFFKYYSDTGCFNPAQAVGSVRCGSVLRVSDCQLFAREHKLVPRQWSAKLLMEEPFDRSNAASAVFNENKWRLVRALLEATAGRINRADSAKLTLEDLSSKKIQL